MSLPRLRSFRFLAVDLVLLTAWLSSVAAVVLHERGELWGGGGNPTATLGATLEAKEQWFTISYANQKVGYSRTAIAPQELNGVPGVMVHDHGEIVFTLLGSPQRLTVAASAFIDADWRLREFTATVRTPSYELRWEGRRQGEELVITMATPGSAVTKRLRDPSGGSLVSGLSSWAAFHRLKVGQSGKAWVLNPLALNPEPLFFHVRRKERVDGQEALVVESEVSGMTTTSWVTPEGEVLKESSPLGWELQRTTAEQAMTSERAASAPGLDLLLASSVPLNRPLEHPERIRRLVLLVEGVDADAFGIRRPWQQVLPEARLADYHAPAPSGPWCLIELTRPVLGRPAPKLPPDVEPRRRPSPFVQSDDPRIVAKAADIVGARTDPWEQTLALNQWVFTTLTKRLTVGLPSAVDVLLTPVGDCHEHTVLFTALARSRGLPTRMVAGLVYWQGRLYYHAWPEVWIGQWVPTDPTLGQPLADATHLGLIEAEDETLIALGRFMGQTSIRVLAVEE